MICCLIESFSLWILSRSNPFIRETSLSETQALGSKFLRHLEVNITEEDQSLIRVNAPSMTSLSRATHGTKNIQTFISMLLCSDLLHALEASKPLSLKTTLSPSPQKAAREVCGGFEGHWRRRKAMAVETESSAAADLALSEVNIDWDRLDKTRFHVIGAILFTALSGLLHPTAVVKTRMQVAGGGLLHLHGFSVFKTVLRNDGIPGIFRGFGTSAIGSLPGRVLALTSLEVSKDMMLKSTESFNMSEATCLAMANGVAGLMSSIVSSAYYVPLDVICQRLMVQGLPGMTTYNGPFDVMEKVLKTEGLRGLYRGFGITLVTQSPASALWWGAYAASQHVIWRSLGYQDDAKEKPSPLELVTVQALAGTVAGACSSIITTPIDTIKTRHQVMDNYGVGRPSVIKTTKFLLEEDGWRGFYRGFGPRSLNMSLWGTSMIVTYELIKRLSVKRMAE